MARDRLVREDIDPYLSAALDESGHCDTRGFDLTGSDPGTFFRDEPEFAVRDFIALVGLTAHLDAVLSSSFHSLRD